MEPLPKEAPPFRNKFSRQVLKKFIGEKRMRNATSSLIKINTLGSAIGGQLKANSYSEGEAGSLVKFGSASAFKVPRKGKKTGEEGEEEG